MKLLIIRSRFTMPVEKRNPIPVNEAIQRVVKQNMFTNRITLPLAESLNYILAEDIVATHEIPRFDKSPYDGFALRSIDTKEASGDNRIKFKVIDHIGAGSVSTKKVGAFEAVRIMTGAQIPEGADSVKGEENKVDDIVLEKGQCVNPGSIAVLATYGYTEVPVFEKPSLAVIATGSELLDVSDDLEPGKIRNSNGPMITALAKKYQLDVNAYKIQQDDLNSSIQVMREAMVEHDIVITTGGVSVGDFDYLSQIYEAVKSKVLFNKIAMRTGSVTTVAVANNKYLFGLSGNPSACFTGFELYVKPAIQHMMGAKAIYPQIVQATLMEDFKKPNPFTRFIRATVTFNGKEMTVVPSGFNKSGAVVAIAHSNAMIVLPSGTRGYQKGHTVDVILTESQAYEMDTTL